VRETRLKAEAAYKNVVKLINALAIVEVPEGFDYNRPIDLLNAEIEHYRQILARKGVSTGSPSNNNGGTGTGTGTEPGTEPGGEEPGGTETGGEEPGNGGNTGGNEPGGNTGGGGETPGGNGGGNTGGNGGDDPFAG